MTRSSAQKSGKHRKALKHHAARHKTQSVVTERNPFQILLVFGTWSLDLKVSHLSTCNDNRKSMLPEIQLTDEEREMLDNVLG